ncbi:hypothetical protein [Aminobacter sp. AP02]|uniref:hypothetical protein n=1 Tax=Aminobacter sp. AP02 TaxID=2135737 RepID=UPI000D6B950A|nr:hypothetical protein [Aminobacter sp. AP02]PWK68125.1 hypothetical protein C8K44_11136 [Aminobacter sp. AP02]
MDTQPRAEDEILPQYEMQSEEPVAADEADAVVLADGVDEPFDEATDDLELVATELLGATTATQPEDAAENLPELTPAEGHVPVTEDVTDNETEPAELASDELAVERIQVDVPAMAPTDVSEAEFTQMVDDALEAVGGILLFKMRIDEDGDDKHVAAASIGDGARRQFLLLSLPVSGGKLKVESASRSNSPLAKLAVAYVGVVEAFRAAA